MKIDIWDVTIFSLLSILALVVCVTYTISAIRFRTSFLRRSLRLLFRKTSHELSTDVEKQKPSNLSLARPETSQDLIIGSIRAPPVAFARTTATLAREESGASGLNYSLQIDEVANDVDETDNNRGHESVVVSTYRLSAVRPVTDGKSFLEVSSSHPPPAYFTTKEEPRVSNLDCRTPLSILFPSQVHIAEEAAMRKVSLREVNVEWLPKAYSVKDKNTVDDGCLCPIERLRRHGFEIQGRRNVVENLADTLKLSHFTDSQYGA